MKFSKHSDKTVEAVQQIARTCCDADNINHCNLVAFVIERGPPEAMGAIIKAGKFTIPERQVLCMLMSQLLVSMFADLDNDQTDLKKAYAGIGLVIEKELGRKIFV